MGNKSSSTQSRSSTATSSHNSTNKSPHSHIDDDTVEVGFIIGQSSIQGKRQYNEDRSYVESPLHLPSTNIKSWSLLCVFDGHVCNVT